MNATMSILCKSMSSLLLSFLLSLLGSLTHSLTHSLARVLLLLLLLLVLPLLVFLVNTENGSVGLGVVLAEEVKAEGTSRVSESVCE